MIGPCLVMRTSSLPVGVLIHPRRSEKAEQRGTKWGRFCGDTAERITVCIPNEN